MDFEKRARELVGQMTLEEKASQLRFDAPAIGHLGIPRYHWWNEGLHGVARAGTATMFPQAIGMAAMFDEDMMQEIGAVVGTEARAKYNAYAAQEDRDIYKGLTLWSPNVNIWRGPLSVRKAGSGIHQRSPGRRRVPFGCCVCKAFCSAQRSGGKAP